MDPDAMAVLQAIASNFSGLEAGILMIAGGLGVFLVGRGTWRLATFESRQRMGEPAFGGVWNCIAGSVLVSYYTTISSQSATIFGDDSGARKITDYATVPSNQAAAILTVLLGLLVVYGYIGIIKGWLMISAMGKAGGNRDTQHWDAVVHLVFGTVAVNMYHAIDFLAGTFGYTNPLKQFLG